MSEGGQRRLETMRETEDGFRIAEVDLEMRGAGDLIGTAQSGLPRFRVADMEGQAALMAVAQTDARKLMADDPDLTRGARASGACSSVADGTGSSDPFDFSGLVRYNPQKFTNVLKKFFTTPPQNENKGATKPAGKDPPHAFPDQDSCPPIPCHPVGGFHRSGRIDGDPCGRFVPAWSDLEFLPAIFRARHPPASPVPYTDAVLTLSHCPGVFASSPIDDGFTEFRIPAAAAFRVRRFF